MKNNRRDFIKKSALLAVGAGTLSSFKNELFAEVLPATETSPFTLPTLPYDYAALEPHIDTLTMQIHHDKHHGAYVNNLNKALVENKIDAIKLEDILTKASSFPSAIRNNAGGHWNHSMFWNMMKPGGGGNPSGEIADAINSAFGTFDDFKKKFSDNAMGRFGSGWTWLIKQNGKLTVGSTPNQDNPLMDASELKGTPILCLDVWEHAYYLHYQNKRVEYVTSWWNLINWDEVARRFKEAK